MDPPQSVVTSRRRKDVAAARDTETPPQLLRDSVENAEAIIGAVNLSVLSATTTGAGLLVDEDLNDRVGLRVEVKDGDTLPP